MSSKPDTESREARFLALWSNAGFDADLKNSCAVQAGWSPSSAAPKSNRIIRALKNNEKMQKALRKRGINYDKLAAKLEDLLEAKHPFAPERPDNMAQQKAMDTAIKIHDAFPPTKIDIEKNERKEIVITGEVVTRLERFQHQRERILRGENYNVLPAAD